jgi:hypothetical protein
MLSCLLESALDTPDHNDLLPSPTSTVQTASRASHADPAPICSRRSGS